MAQNKGEQGPDRIDTPGLQAWKALKATLTLEDMALIRCDCAHSLAAVDNFSDEPGRNAAARRNLILLAIDDADTRSRIATRSPTEPGWGIETIDHYEHYKLPGEPGRGAIYREFRSWQAAKNEAGVGKVSQPGVGLLRTKGKRNRQGRGIQWSLDDRARALALFRERRSPGARRLGHTLYEEFRASWTSPLPQYKTVIGQVPTTINGEKCLRQEFTWPQMNVFAEELALREPETFPKLAERAKLERAASHGNKGVATEIDPSVEA